VTVGLLFRIEAKPGNDDAATPTVEGFDVLAATTGLSQPDPRVTQVDISAIRSA
jgi:hypothetical protein